MVCLVCLDIRHNIWLKEVSVQDVPGPSSLLKTRHNGCLLSLHGRVVLEIKIKSHFPKLFIQYCVKLSDKDVD